MTFGCLGSGRDDRLGQAVILSEPIGQRYSANLPFTGLVLTPRMAYQVATDDHLYPEGLALIADGYTRVCHINHPIGHNIFRLLQELGRNLVAHLALLRKTRESVVRGKRWSELV